MQYIKDEKKTHEEPQSQFLVWRRAVCVELWREHWKLCTSLLLCLLGLHPPLCVSQMLCEVVAKLADVPSQRFLRHMMRPQPRVTCLLGARRLSRPVVATAIKTNRCDKHS